MGRGEGWKEREERVKAVAASEREGRFGVSGPSRSGRQAELHYEG